RRRLGQRVHCRHQAAGSQIWRALAARMARNARGALARSKYGRRRMKLTELFGKKQPQEPREENPYLNARRAWNDHVGSVVSAHQSWQVIGILSLLIALTAIGGIIHVGSQSKFIPYVVEVDKQGQT